jgi:AcrR family transcriptional regulator
VPRASALPPDERRAQILTAAEPLLRTHGRNVSTRQIAQAANVAEGTIFRVFDSKNDLIDQTVMRVVSAERSVELLQQIDPQLELEEKLIQIVGVMQQRLRQTFELFHALGPRPQSTEEDHKAFGKHMNEQNQLMVASVARLIDTDQDRLLLTTDQTVQLLATVTMSVSHPMITRTHGIAHLSDDPAAIVDLVLHGALADDSRTGTRFDHRGADPAPLDLTACSTAS